MRKQESDNGTSLFRGIFGARFFCFLDRNLQTAGIGTKCPSQNKTFQTFIGPREEDRAPEVGIEKCLPFPLDFLECLRVKQLVFFLTMKFYIEFKYKNNNHVCPPISRNGKLKLLIEDFLYADKTFIIKTILNKNFHNN